MHVRVSVLINTSLRSVLTIFFGDCGVALDATSVCAGIISHF